MALFKLYRPGWEPGGGNTPMILMVLGGTDSNASITDGDVAPTVLARAGTGGQRADNTDGGR